MRSISSKIVFCTVMIVCVSLAVLGTLSCVMSYNSAVSIVSRDMQELAEITAERISLELDSYLTLSENTGCNDEFTHVSTNDKRRRDIVTIQAIQYNMREGNYISKEGLDFEGDDFSAEQFFAAAMEGSSSITEPFLDSDGSMKIRIAAPVWDGGVVGRNITGCVYYVPGEEFLNDIVRNISISENSVGYIIDAQGNTIAAVDAEKVKSGENIETLALSDSAYAELAEAHAKMRNGEAGFAAHNVGGEKMFIGYCPIRGTNGWSLAVEAPAMDFIYDCYRSIFFTIIVLAVSIIAAVVISFALGRTIGKPIRLCTERIEKLAQGDLSSGVPEIRTYDETGRLSEATRTVAASQNSIISDIGRILEEISDGNLNTDTEKNAAYYMGDYSKLLSYLNDITSSLSGTMTRINTAADQVSAGAEQVACGAQSLSSGASDQSIAVQKLSDEINGISELISRNAAQAENAVILAAEAGRETSAADEKIRELIEAMGRIKASSDETKEIISTIEDIAFQTNILALNAAVEAARAGAAGRGFAVVADEVRNLAERSAEAAQSTTALIEGTVKAINSGSGIADAAAESIKAVSRTAIEVSDRNARISADSRESEESVKQITFGMDSISNVVQNNTATAEESAAASEELSGQAMMLRELIGHFNFKEESVFAEGVYDSVYDEETELPTEDDESDASWDEQSENN